MRDFTTKAYAALCGAVKENHTPVTVLEFLKRKSIDAAIIRHDVDDRPMNSLIAAKIEHKLDISSTYYFRTTPRVYKEGIINEIRDLGHEIGFHYEVLDKAQGDYKKAIAIFEKEVMQFPCEIKTICMHGNPITRWDNRDLWEKYRFEDYGIVGDAYLSIDFSDIMYFSDTGRTWDSRYSVKDITKAKRDAPVRVKSTEDLIGVVRKDEGRVCIATHPQRWTDSHALWGRELLLQSSKNLVKKGIMFARPSKR